MHQTSLDVVVITICNNDDDIEETSYCANSSSGAKEDRSFKNSNIPQEQQELIRL